VQLSPLRVYIYVRLLAVIIKVIRGNNVETQEHMGSPAQENTTSK
jgi:hypothetical protein